MKFRKVNILFIIFIIAFLILVYTGNEGFTSVQLNQLYTSSGTPISASTSSSYTSPSASVGENRVFNGLSKEVEKPIQQLKTEQPIILEQSTPPAASKVVTTTTPAAAEENKCCTIS